jgi:hypothetical protein
MPPVLRSNAPRCDVCVKDKGLTNLCITVPFCRRVEEARRVLDAMASHGRMMPTPSESFSTK